MNQTTIWEKLSKWCLYLLIFLAPIMFLPWTADPVGVNKQAVVMFLAVLSFVFWLAKTLSEGKLVWPKNLINIGVAIFLAILGLSAYFSASPSESLYNLFGRADNFPSFAVFGLVFLLTAVLLRSGEDITRAVWILLVSSGLLAVFQTIHFTLGSFFGNFLLPWDFGRVIDFNPVGTANALSIFFGFGLIAAVTMLVSGIYSGKAKILLYAFGSLFLLNVIAIGFWETWLGLVIAMICLISYRFVKELNLAKVQGVSEFSVKKLSLPIAIFVIAFLLLLAKPPIGSFLNFSVEIKPTYGATMDIAKNVIGQDWLRTFFGSGPGTFVNDYLRYRSASLNATGLWPLSFNQGFGFWPTILATGGYLGAAAFAFAVLAFLFSALKALTRKLRETPVTVAGRERLDLELGLVFGICGGLFLLILLFLYPLNYIFALELFFAIALFVISAAHLREEGFRSVSLLISPQRALILSLLAILLMTFSVYGLYAGGKKYAAEIYVGRALPLVSDVKTVDRALVSLNSAVNLNPDSSSYLRIMAQAFLVQINKIINQKPSEELSQSQIQEQLQAAITSAINAAQAAVRLDKENFSNLWTLGSVYENLILFAEGADKQAVQTYEEASKRNPQSPSIQLDIARTHLASAGRIDLSLDALARQEKKEPEKEEALKKERESKIASAKAALDKSLSLKSDYVPAHYLYSQLYDRVGDSAKAIEKAEDARKYAPADLSVLFQLGRLYYNGDQLDKAQAVFENSAAINPNYSNGRYFLGLTYDKQGFKNKAIAEFEKVAELNPDSEEVKKILENLKAGSPALLNLGQPTSPAPTPPPQAPEEKTKSQGKTQ